jgi:metal-responsive CopG/Arc/MetJ family transcriptional regulator
MRKTIYLPDDLAAQVDEYLKAHRGESLSSLVQEALKDRVAPRDPRGILRLAGLVDVEPFENEELARRFADRPEDQFYDRV